MTLKILVLSDTHWYDVSQIPYFLENNLKNYDAVIHAGDFVSHSVVELLAAHTNLFAVMGNCDEYSARRFLPEKKMFTLGGVNIGLIHGTRKNFSYIYELHAIFEGADLVIFGHSHIPSSEKIADTVFFNPGSFTHPRDGNAPSAGVLEINDSAFSVEHIFF